jgi:hypothetical protein
MSAKVAIFKLNLACVCDLKARYSQVKNALRVVFELVDSDKSGHLVSGYSNVTV